MSYYTSLPPEQFRQRRRDVQVRGGDAEDGSDASADVDGVDPPATQRADPPTAHGPICSGKKLRDPNHHE